MEFAKQTQFFDVEGIPVTIGAGDASPGIYCAAWDVKPPRKFNPESARENGAPIDQAAFEAMVKVTAP